MRFYDRAFAAGYDYVLGRSERAGLADIRRDLLSQATGRTVELGAGTGLNLEHYPQAVTELVLTEPDRHMARQARAKAGSRAEVIEAPGEDLPFEDASADTIVFTMILCTAPDPDAVLREAHRVLKPGGRVLFFEHVRSEDPRLARWQDRLRGPWELFGNGCRCNQATAEFFESSPLQVESIERGRIPRAMPLVRPLLRGTASKPVA
ncbi:MAG: class I SAM-dependent methyltransferase [Thermoleophilaceae bacterium]|nr:class I SAM-dependent methyltransferase [Thermoleophilaceae bacterium]